MARDRFTWPIQLLLAAAFLVLAFAWASRAEAGYDGTFHLEPTAERIVKRDGLVLWRILDGPVRCYLLITEARMIGVQSTMSCVIPEIPLKPEGRDADEHGN